MARKKSSTAAEIDAFARRCAANITATVPGTVSYADAIAESIARTCAEPEPDSDSESATHALDTD